MVYCTRLEFPNCDVLQSLKIAFILANNANSANSDSNPLDQNFSISWFKDEKNQI